MNITRIKSNDSFKKVCILLTRNVVAYIPGNQNNGKGAITNMETH